MDRHVESGVSERDVAVHLRRAGPADQFVYQFGVHHVVKRFQFQLVHSRAVGDADDEDVTQFLVGPARLFVRVTLVSEPPVFERLVQFQTGRHPVAAQVANRLRARVVVHDGRLVEFR